MNRIEPRVEGLDERVECLDERGRLLLDEGHGAGDFQPEPAPIGRQVARDAALGWPRAARDCV